MPWPGEILVLEGVVEPDRAGVLQAGSEVHAVDTRPVDGAHAHGARGAVDIDLAPLEHPRPARHRVRRSLRAGDQLKGRARGLIGVQESLGIQASHGVHDGRHLRVEDGNPGEEDAVLTPADDLAILDDDGAERAAPPLLHRFDSQPCRLFREPRPVHPGPLLPMGPKVPPNVKAPPAPARLPVRPNVVPPRADVSWAARNTPTYCPRIGNAASGSVPHMSRTGARPTGSGSICSTGGPGLQVAYALFCKIMETWP